MVHTVINRFTGAKVKMRSNEDGRNVEDEAARNSNNHGQPFS